MINYLKSILAPRMRIRELEREVLFTDKRFELAVSRELALHKHNEHLLQRNLDLLKTINDMRIRNNES